MKTTTRTAWVSIAISTLLLGSASVAAQQGPGGRGGGGFDPAQMQQRMMERYQEQLGASADEWKVIEPLLSSVLEKQRANSGNQFRGMMMGRRGGNPSQAQGGDQAQNTNRRRGGGFFGEPSPEVEALSAALESDKTSKADLKAKMDAVINVRKKSQAELAGAREKLRRVLTLRQEAQLVLAGILD